MDITAEIKELIEQNLKPGQYMFSDTFSLEDALPAIDIEHAKMDRGIVKINGEYLMDFVDGFFKSLSLLNTHIDLGQVLQTLFRLEMTWYTGTAYFNDTILTCVLMHRDPSILSARTGNALAALAVESTMTIASLISYLMTASSVIREEDFNANLYGMNWWTSTYAGCHLPRPGSNQPPPNDIQLQLLLDRLMTACRHQDSSSNRFYFARFYYWIKFLNGLIRSTIITGSDPVVIDLISELQAVILPLELESENAERGKLDANSFVHPELANMFGRGCVRPMKQILSLEAAIRTWNRCLQEDMNNFISRLLILRPRFGDLIRTLSERSRDPLKPPLLPITRAVLFSVLLQGRFGKIFENESILEFTATSLPSPLSLAKLESLPVLLQDVIQIYCCTPSRQRRLLPKILQVWDEQVIGKIMQDGESTGYRALCWMKDFRDRMAIDLILLFGHLKLLSSPREEFQAVRIISSIFGRFVEEGKEVPCDLCDRIEIDSAFDRGIGNDAIRWNHRWALIAKNDLNRLFRRKEQPETSSDTSVTIFESVLFWFKSMIRAGLAGHSFNHLDWQHDEIFATPPQYASYASINSQSHSLSHSQPQSQYTSFTMNTTEIDIDVDSMSSSSSSDLEETEQFYFDDSNVFT